MKNRLALLWLIREHQPISIEELFHKVSTMPPLFYPQGVRVFISKFTYQGAVPRRLHKLQEYCQDLSEQGLIEASNQNNPKEEWAKEIFKTTGKLEEILRFFGISLTGLVDRPADARIVYPVFGKPAPPGSRWAQIFVAMPFNDTLKVIYDENILEVTHELNLTCQRGDDFHNSNIIMDDVWNSIIHAEICIIDCTGHNPNVFYELGITHTVGTPAILIAQAQDDIPFDLRHMRFIIYDMNNLAQFREKLKLTLQSMLNQG